MRKLVSLLNRSVALQIKSRRGSHLKAGFEGTWQQKPSPSPLLFDIMYDQVARAPGGVLVKRLGRGIIASRKNMANERQESMGQDHIRYDILAQDALRGSSARC